MNIQSFFSHWNLTENPFIAEESADDEVYANVMESGVAHPDFEKIYGRPTQPNTAVVFGEKGSGKTAIRLLIEDRIRRHNEKHPDKRSWIVRYDDWNHMVDRVIAENPLGFDAFRVEDHLDKINSLIVTELVDAATRPGSSPEARATSKKVKKLPRQQRLDLAVLAMLYDQPNLSSPGERWQALRKMLKIGNKVSPRALLLVSGTAWVAFAVGMVGISLFSWASMIAWVIETVLPVIGVVSGFPGIRQAMRNRKRRINIQKEIRVVDHPTDLLGRQLNSLRSIDLDSMPIPTPGNHDARYDLQGRLQRLLNYFDYSSITILVDRVDEPAQINGDTIKMRKLTWPMFSNKFLQRDGVGIKMLLPIELGYELKREDADFYRRARLDKSNLIERLEWTGVTLYDICNQRLQAVHTGSGTGKTVPQLQDLFEDNVQVQDIVDALDQMHQPRDAFKFLYEILLQHCKNTTDSNPNFVIPKLTLEQVRRSQSQRVADLTRGYSPA